MGAPLIRVEMSMEEIFENIVFTRSRLLMLPLTAGLAAPFDALRVQWTTTNNKDLDLQAKVADATAVVQAKDDDLDDFVDAVIAGFKGDRKNDLYVLLIGSTTPSKFKRPILGDQLESMKLWVSPLTASKIPGMAALGASLPALLSGASDAAAALTQAESDLETHRTVGDKRTLVDAVNAARQTADGMVSTMPHGKPELGLPADFGDRFFLHDTAPKKAGKTRLEKQLLSLQTKTDTVKARLGAVTAAATEKAANATKATQLDTQIVAARTDAEAAAAKLKALQDQRDKL